MKVTTTMAREAKGPDYSDDEIEQILGMGVPDTKMTLKEIRQTIRDNPLLMAALIFSIGILVGASLGRARKKS